MILFIHGQDTYSSREYLERVIDKFKQKHDPNGENVLVFDGEDSQWEKVVGAITGGGLFSSKKLIILKDIFASKELREALNEFLDAHDLDADVSLVVYEGASPDKRSSLFKKLNKGKFVYAFNALDGRAIEQHITRMAEERGKKIEPSAIRELSIICGTDLWRAKSEIEKLASLVSDIITINDVKENTQGKLENDIWQFVDAISSANKKEALNMLDAQLESGVEPMYLLSMMIRQFRLLITLHNAQGVDSALASSLSLHPFVVKKTRQQSGRFSIEKLKAIYQALSRLDSALKSSKGDPKVLFTVLIDSMVK
ncbi:MAG: DNA polymerase III subunit delta [Parcubacteria group bacterium CG11_big_fil_rev_8_21_14_0_20_41_14]|nr:MAG: DNA polymerase III subunit delta [Parcubacteria group bacterium CG11_big_fil_rev_8_21_14_0_20_41_14]